MVVEKKAKTESAIISVKLIQYQVVQKKLVVRLLDCGADNCVKNFRGLTPYQLAYQLGNATLGDLLLLYDG